MTQVVIRRRSDDKFLKRKYSYHVTTWTPDLQKALVLTWDGAKRSIVSMGGYTYEGGIEIEVDCYIQDVQLELKE